MSDFNRALEEREVKLRVYAMVKQLPRLMCMASICCMIRFSSNNLILLIRLMILWEIWLEVDTTTKKAWPRLL